LQIVVIQGDATSQIVAGRPPMLDAVVTPMPSRFRPSASVIPVTDSVSWA
jgi:hypothetical protein